MIASFLFILIALCYFFPVLACRLIFTERDLAPYFIPPRILWVSLVKSLEVPLWNPYNYSGLPLLATLQPGVFYPPHLFYLVLPFNVVWNWIIILHFPFAAITLYALMRHLGAGKQASFVSGLLFMLSGYLISVHNLLPHLLSVAWLPLVLLFYLRHFESGRARHLVWSSLCLSMEYLAGAPEIVIMTLLVLAVMTFFIRSFVVASPSGIIKAKAFGTICLLFVLLCAVQILPFVELKMWSIRRAGLDYREAIIWSFAWKDFLQFFIPDPYGYFTSEARTWQNQSWLKTVYWGVGPFVLSSFYFLRRDGKQPFFLILIAVSFLLALGGNTPLYRWLYQLPPFDTMRYPVKYLVIFFFMVSMTAGFGLDRLRKGVEEGSAGTKRAITVFFYVGFAFAILFGYMVIFDARVVAYFQTMGFVPMSYNSVSTNIHNIERFLLFSFPVCTGLVFYLGLKRRAWVISVLILLIGADLFCANYQFFRCDLWTSYTSRHAFTAFLAVPGSDYRYLYSPKASAEFKYYPEDRLSFSPSYASLTRVYGVDGMEVFRTAYQDHFLHLIERLGSLAEAKRYFPLLGISHLVTPYEIEGDGDFRLLSQTPVPDGKKAYLYAYEPYRGRFLVYHRSRRVTGEEQTKAILEERGFDPAKELILEGPPSESRSFGTGKDTVRPVLLSDKRVIIETETETDGFLYGSDTFYPGWRASIDGKPARIERANLAFRSVFLPRGSHRIVFVYEPFSFYAGVGASLLGIALCAIMIARDVRRGRRSRSGDADEDYWKDVVW